MPIKVDRREVLVYYRLYPSAYGLLHTVVPVFDSESLHATNWGDARCRGYAYFRVRGAGRGPDWAVTVTLAKAGNACAAVRMPPYLMSSDRSTLR